MSNDFTNDVIIEAFLINYGMTAALEDVGVNSYQKTSEDNIIAVCPFHADTKPSFSVNLSNGLFQCFACDAHGNLYQFIQLAYDLSYKQAKEYIMARSGLSEGVNLEDLTLLRKIKQSLIKINAAKTEETQDKPISPEMISRMYQREDPHNYLLGRNFKPETIKYFECGYTDDWLGKGYNKQERITIPVHDEYGTIKGFIGRTPVNAMPKYINTGGLSKSHLLYNLNRAAKYAQNGLILVEGTLDVMRLHDLGYPNAVAILGAKLSETQLHLLTKYTDKIYLMFDSDEAGSNANLSALEMTKDLLEVYFVPLKTFKDPGEIMEPETLKQLLSNAKNWFTYNVQEGVNKKWHKKK